MVNPMPAHIPAPVICNHLMPLDKLLIFNLTARKDINDIPKGFLISKPAIIPKLKLENLYQSFPVEI